MASSQNQTDILYGTEAMNESLEPLQRPHPRPAGTVVPWSEMRKELPEMSGDENVVRQNWEMIDAWTYAFVWHCVVSF